MTKDFLDSVQETAERAKFIETVIDDFHEEDKEYFRDFAKMFQYSL